MAKKPTTDAHARTRRDHASETAEDYVEAAADIIAAKNSCRVIDLAEHFGVSHVTVVKIVQRLEKEGYVTTKPYQPIELTHAGQQLAADSKRRHEIVFAFLRAIGVSEQTAAIDSEGIEHHVSDETLACFESITRRADTSAETPSSTDEPNQE